MSESGALATAAQRLTLVADELQRLGLTLNAIGSLTTCGDPGRMSLAALKTDEVGAMFEHFGRDLLSLKDELDPLIHLVREHGRPPERNPQAP
ncbi:MAG: hypothetical protein ACK44A_03615 [Roseateles sp.]